MFNNHAEQFGIFFLLLKKNKKKQLLTFLLLIFFNTFFIVIQWLLSVNHTVTWPHYVAWVVQLSSLIWIIVVLQYSEHSFWFVVIGWLVDCAVAWLAGRVWDKVISGSCKILVFVAVEILLSYKILLMGISHPDGVYNFLSNVSISLIQLHVQTFIILKECSGVSAC